jgi:hypothetical protein
MLMKEVQKQVTNLGTLNIEKWCFACSLMHDDLFIMGMILLFDNNR